MRMKKKITIFIEAVTYIIFAVLYSIPRVLQGSFFSEVGTEGVYFELF